MDQSLRYMGLGDEVHHPHHHRGSSGHYHNLPPYPPASQLPMEPPSMFPHRSISLDTGILTNHPRQQQNHNNGPAKSQFDTVCHHSQLYLASTAAIRVLISHITHLLVILLQLLSAGRSAFPSYVTSDDAACTSSPGRPRHSFVAQSSPAVPPLAPPSHLRQMSADAASPSFMRFAVQGPPVLSRHYSAIQRGSEPKLMRAANQYYIYK